MRDALQWQPRPGPMPTEWPSDEHAAAAERWLACLCDERSEYAVSLTTGWRDELKAVAQRFPADFVAAVLATCDRGPQWRTAEDVRFGGEVYVEAGVSGWLCASPVVALYGECATRSVERRQRELRETRERQEREAAEARERSLAQFAAMTGQVLS